MSEDSEFDKAPRHIEWLGPVGGENPDPSLWKGPISARAAVIAERFEVNQDEAPSIMRGLKELAQGKFLRAKRSAIVRCIDGRGEDQESATTELAPQVPGGAPVMALCYRMANWKVGQTIEDDLQELKDMVIKLGLPYVPGAHEDEHNEHNEDKTGCGAIDKMFDILQTMGNSEVMLPYVKAIMGSDVPEALLTRTVEDIGVKIEILNGQHFRDNYFMKDPKTGKYKFGDALIKRMKKFGRDEKTKTVEKLTGEHKELLLIVNKVSGETFDRDGLSAELEGRAQAFNYDMWHAVDRAKALYADNESAQLTMVAANIMYAVATAMNLTDGSLELGIRQ